MHCGPEEQGLPFPSSMGPEEEESVPPGDDVAEDVAPPTLEETGVEVPALPVEEDCPVLVLVAPATEVAALVPAGRDVALLVTAAEEDGAGLLDPEVREALVPPDADVCDDVTVTPLEEPPAFPDEPPALPEDPPAFPEEAPAFPEEAPTVPEEAPWSCVGTHAPSTHTLGDAQSALEAHRAAGRMVHAPSAPAAANTIKAHWT